jgi:hypothetical protein
MIIKAITLHQPWASAIADGFKQIETRGWGTGYRGPLAIHAGKTIDWFNAPKEAMDLYKAGELPIGSIVAITELVDCQKMTPLLIASVSPREREWGFYKEGRIAWLLRVTIKLRETIPARGNRMLWDWKVPEEFESLLKR